MLVCRVAVGRPFIARSDQQNLTQPPSGFDSVFAAGGTDSSVNFDELIVYEDNALIPAYVIRYNTELCTPCSPPVYFNDNAVQDAVCRACKRSAGSLTSYLHCFACGDYDLCESCYYHRPPTTPPFSHHFHSPNVAQLASHPHPLSPVMPSYLVQPENVTLLSFSTNEFYSSLSNDYSSGQAEETENITIPISCSNCNADILPPSHFLKCDPCNYHLCGKCSKLVMHDQHDLKLCKAKN